VRVAPKPLGVLVHLARRHPASVSRRELLRSLWPGVRVTRASLSRAVRGARRALGESAGDGSVVRTVRGRGYALDAPITTPSHSRARGEVPFIGRAGELLRFEGLLDAADLRRGRLALVSGEPGIGKSRLLEEVAARARSRGALVVLGQCREDDGAPPYWPWPEVLRGLAAGATGRAARGTATHLASIAALLEDAPVRPRAAPAAVDTDARFRLLRSVADLIRRVAELHGAPVVVQLEDLHWARPGALHLLRFVARSLADVSVLLVATYRGTAPPMSPELAAAVGEIVGLPQAEPDIRLSGFERQEIEAYVSSATGHHPDARLVQQLQALAGGNPLFLRGLVATTLGASGTPGRGPVSLPASVQHVLSEQVSRLSQPAREVVEAASVIGRSGSLQLLARVTRRRVESALELVDEARGQNLLSESPEGGWRFTHDVVRSVLYQRLSSERRIQLHHRVATTIEAVASASTTPHLAELSHHFVEALPRSSLEKAVRYARAAAAQAHRAFDFDGAALHHRRALRALEHRSVDDAHARCDVLLALGESLSITGRLSESREAILSAATLARGLDSAGRLARAALACGAWPQTLFADAELIRVVEDALRAVGRRRPALRARLLAGLAMLSNVEGDRNHTARLLDESLEVANRIGDPTLRCDVLRQRLVALSQGVPEGHAARLLLTEEILEISAGQGEIPESPGRIDLVLQCRRHRIALLLETGAGSALDDEIECFARVSAAGRCKGHYVAAFRAMRATVAGRFEEARQAIDEAERLADPISPEESRFTPAGQRLELPPDWRDSESLKLAIARLLVEFPQVTPWRGAHALVALDLGRTEVARAELDLLAADDFALVPQNLSYLVTLGTLVEVSWRLGEKRHARRLHELLAPHDGVHISAGLGVLYRGPVAWYLGLLAEMLGRRDEARRRFEDALAGAAVLGAWPWHARTELCLASLLATGSSAERKRARKLAASAAATAARLGIAGICRGAERVLEGRADEVAGASRRRADRGRSHTA
jgi:tetratricopeptide (TPR) repeat protein